MLHCDVTVEPVHVSSHRQRKFTLCPCSFATSSNVNTFTLDTNSCKRFWLSGASSKPPAVHHLKRPRIAGSSEQNVEFVGLGTRALSHVGALRFCVSCVHSWRRRTFSGLRSNCAFFNDFEHCRFAVHNLKRSRIAGSAMSRWTAFDRH